MIILTKCVDPVAGPPSQAPAASLASSGHAVSGAGLTDGTADCVVVVLTNWGFGNPGEFGF